MKRKKIFEIITIILGSVLVSFAICNIHSKMKITEGGQLGIELLLLNWFKISPSISSVIIDFILYLIGFLVLGKKYRINAIIGTISYSISYYLFENISLTLTLPNNLLLLSIIGGILVGVGCGLVVKKVEMILLH